MLQRSQLQLLEVQQLTPGVPPFTLPTGKVLLLPPSRWFNWSLTMTLWCDKRVPDLEVSGRGDKDQRRHGARRLLQKSDNSSLEEGESEESKNCTVPGKTE